MTHDKTKMLTMADLIRGGDEPQFRMEVIAGLKKNGEDGVVFVREASAGLLVELTDIDDAAAPKARNKLRDLTIMAVREGIVDPDTGFPLFDDVTVRQLTNDVLVKLSNAVLGIKPKDSGAASGAADGVSAEGNVPAAEQLAASSIA